MQNLINHISTCWLHALSFVRRLLQDFRLLISSLQSCKASNISCPCAGTFTNFSLPPNFISAQCQPLVLFHFQLILSKVEEMLQGCSKDILVTHRSTTCFSSLSLVFGMYLCNEIKLSETVQREQTDVTVWHNCISEVCILDVKATQFDTNWGSLQTCFLVSSVNSFGCYLLEGRING